MIDPDVGPKELANLYDGPLEGDLVGAYPVRRGGVELYPDHTVAHVARQPTCRDCGKQNSTPWMPRCVSCQFNHAQREQDENLTNKVVERAERDPVYAARLKMALGL